MKYAIVSNPRDRISAGLGAASSVAIVSLNLARCLARRFEVSVVAACATGEQEREQLAPNLKVVRISRRRAKLHKYRELAAVAFTAIPPHFLSERYHHDYYLQAAQALAAEAPDVIHIHNYGQAAAVFRKYCPKARIVIQLHDTSLAQVDAATARRVLGKADLIVTCSEYVARTVHEAHPWIQVPVCAINNGVDLDDFSVRGARGADSTAVQLLYIGRLSPEKGVHVLIEAFNRVTEKAPGTRLDLAGGASLFSYAVVKLFRHDRHWAAILPFYGSNPLLRVFRHLHHSGKRYMAQLMSAQSAAAAGATRYLGEQSHSAIAELLQQADILIVPSVCDEPFGIPAVEAMAAGVPVVAAAAGGLCQIVEPGVSGMLIPRSDAGALADALLGLIADEPRRASLGRGARRAAQRFSWECAAHNLLAALQSAAILPPAAPSQTIPE